jgi:N-hydroxyarylamine O-acetyltransferase
MRTATVAAVLERLELEPPAPDLDGLRAVYGAWCRSVPFDNVLKLIRLAEGAPGPLPGSTADGFFGAWLEHGTGGTCWSGNGALHDLLDALGFTVDRVIATMLSSPRVTEPNHGSVAATVEGERWLVDASILGGAPIRLPASGVCVESPQAPGAVPDHGPLPRFEWLDGRPAVRWRTPSAPGGFHCRIERIGAGAAEWDARHQRTRDWSPFNYQLTVRLLDGGAAVGVAHGRRYRIAADGQVAEEELDREGRAHFLVEVIGISEELAARVPDDRPLPPRPA